MRFANTQILSALDASANQTSAAMDASYMVAASVQVVATGITAAGTLKVQASNDLPLPGNTPTNWFDVTSETVTIAAPGVAAIPKFDVCYQWLRLVWTKSGSSNDGLITSEIKTIGF